MLSSELPFPKRQKIIWKQLNFFFEKWSESWPKNLKIDEKWQLCLWCKLLVHSEQRKNIFMTRIIESNLNYYELKLKARLVMFLFETLNNKRLCWEELTSCILSILNVATNFHYVIFINWKLSLKAKLIIFDAKRWNIICHPKVFHEKLFTLNFWPKWRQNFAKTSRTFVQRRRMTE